MADAKSAVAAILHAAVRQRALLDEAFRRDSEALRVLSTEPALGEALARVEQRYWDEKAGHRWRPGWTRRDEKRLLHIRAQMPKYQTPELLRHLRNWVPASRVDRLLSRWGQRNGYAAFTNLFRGALDEARSDGTASVVAPKIDSLKDSHDHLLEVARCISGDVLTAPNGRHEWNEALARHSQAAADLVDYCPPQQASDRENGPCHPFTWRKNGYVIRDKMQTAAWKMVDFLWSRPDRSASFDELLLPVYNDAEHVADGTAFGSLRKAANKFFGRHGVPWRVSISKTVVSLMNST